VVYNSARREEGEDLAREKVFSSEKGAGKKKEGPEGIRKKKKKNVLGWELMQREGKGTLLLRKGAGARTSRGKKRGGRYLRRKKKKKKANPGEKSFVKEKERKGESLNVEGGLYYRGKKWGFQCLDEKGERTHGLSG